MLSIRLVQRKRGRRREAEVRLCLQDIQLCTEVPLLGKVTGRGHLVEAKNTTTHFCNTHIYVYIYIYVCVCCFGG